MPAKATTKASAKASTKASGKAGKTADTVPAKAKVTPAKPEAAADDATSKSGEVESREAAIKLSAKKRKPKKKQDAATAKDHDAFKEVCTPVVVENRSNDPTNCQRQTGFA